jgi:hypothetical protein
LVHDSKCEGTQKVNGTQHAVWTKPYLNTLVHSPATQYIILMLVVLGTLANTHAQEKPKLAHVEVDRYGVSAEGVWRPDNPTKENALVEAVTSFSCSRHGGRDLVGTEAWCLSVAASAPMGILDVQTQWIKVVEWSDTQVIATDESSICLTSQTIFDLRSKTVLALDVRKADAKGISSVCKTLPDRQTYFLQDKADYYTYKFLHPK